MNGNLQKMRSNYNTVNGRARNGIIRFLSDETTELFFFSKTNENMTRLLGKNGTSLYGATNYLYSFFKATVVEGRAYAVVDSF